jgi:outer membrane protein TolC
MNSVHMRTPAMVRRALIASLALLACAPAAGGAARAGDAPPLLTLADALALARAGNRPLVAVRFEADRAKARVAAGRTRRFPVVDFTGMGGVLVSPVTFTLPRGFLGQVPGLGAFPPGDVEYSVPRRPAATIAASIAQPLSQQFRIGLALAQGRLGEQVARAHAGAAEEAVAFNVRRAYYAVAQAESSLRSATDALALCRELDRLVRGYAAEQVVLEAEALEVGARLAQQEQAVAALRHSRLSLAEQLNLLLGRDLSTAFAVEPALDLPMDALDLDAGRTRALAERADVGRARLERQQADLGVRIARATRIPDVSLALSYASTVNVDLMPHHIATFGVLVRYEPLTWGRRGHEIAETQIVARQAATAVTEAEQRAVLEVNARYRSVEDARALVPVAQQAERAARERLRVAAARFAEDAVLVKEVLQQQQALAEATSRLEQARLGYWSARAEFLQATGDKGDR